MADFYDDDDYRESDQSFKGERIRQNPVSTYRSSSQRQDGRVQQGQKGSVARNRGGGVGARNQGRGFGVKNRGKGLGIRNRVRGVGARNRVRGVGARNRMREVSERNMGNRQAWLNQRSDSHRPGNIQDSGNRRRDDFRENMVERRRYSGSCERDDLDMLGDEDWEGEYDQEEEMEYQTETAWLADQDRSIEDHDVPRDQRRRVEQEMRRDRSPRDGGSRSSRDGGSRSSRDGGSKSSRDASRERDGGRKARRVTDRDRSPRDGGSKSSRDASREHDGGHKASRVTDRDRSPRDRGSRATQDSPRNRSKQKGNRVGRLQKSAAEIRQEKQFEKWKGHTPSNVVLLTGLHPKTEDADIYPLLHPFHAKVQDMRIIRKRGGVAPDCRGFAFVDFLTTEDAEKWMETTKKTLIIRERRVTLYYSVTSDRKSRFKGDPGWMRWASSEPASSVVIWNIPSDVNATQIEEKFAETEYKLNECKILLKKSTGEPRGFGFLDFCDVGTAEKWFNASKGILTMSDKIILAAYSSGTGLDKRKPWKCIKCGADNFKIRNFCFKCSLSREDSEKNVSCDGAEDVGSNPCNTLIFRGLDALTTEETLNRALHWTTGFFCKNVIVMRDTLTKVSMSYAFGEMATINEAKKVLEFLNNSSNPLEVDGKQILVSFAKNTYNTVLTTLGYAPPPSQQICTETPSLVDIDEANPAAKSSPSPKKEIKKKTKTDMEKTSKTAAKDKKVNLLELNLVNVTGFLYDPEEDKYYNAKIVKKCPVVDCRLKKPKKWLALRRHWLSCHVPTKRGYLCQYGPCKTKSTSYSTVNLFFRHLESHKYLQEHEYDETLSKAKIKLLPNRNFLDPGNAVLPPPILTEGPKLELPETKCPVKQCPHSYTTLENMQSHWAQFHSVNITMYRCGVCDTIDRDKKVMSAHMDEKHGNMDATSERVVLESKQYIDPGNVVPFWSLYHDNDIDDDDNDDEKLGIKFPLMKVPSVGNDPEDLCEFLSWTERYMQRLQNVQKDALRDLQKLAQRKLDKKWHP